MIIFNEEEHKYFNEKGLEYISVTTLLGTFKKPFDSEMHAKRVAERTGTTVESVLASWKKTTVEAQERGTGIHKKMEAYIKFGECLPEDADMIKSFNNAIEGFKHSKKTAEGLLWIDDARIAGTADIILENDKEFYILDFKTNKKFKFMNDFGEKLLPPLSYLDYCEFTIYSMQLSLYAYMLQKQSGKHCKGLKVLYLSTNTFTNSRFWREIPILYCKDTIHNIVEQRKRDIENANS